MTNALERSLLSRISAHTSCFQILFDHPQLGFQRYYALSATCALFKHVEVRLNTRFAAGSLRIRYVPVDGTMMIDSDTTRNLELVANISNKKSTYSLYGYADNVSETHPECLRF